MKHSINTNELRDFADTMPAAGRDYLYAVADELGAVRTQRNIARAELRKLKARRPGEKVKS
ncbi:MAG: hypothetical protein Q8S09_00400 [Hyphomonas sp.]|nr:hypothetical protein [Hyphomonas sp.]